MHPIKYTARCLEDARELTREELDQILDQLLRLPPALQAVLDAELKAGNKVADVGCNYPDHGSICVTLAKRFKTKHKNSNLVYRLTKDPHYWYAEYCTTSLPGYLLLCGW